MEEKDDRPRAGIRALKNEAPRILGEVHEEKVEYVVTRRGKPIAVIRPWSKEDDHRSRAKQAAVILDRLEDTALRVANRAGRRSAVAAVSRQRR